MGLPKAILASLLLCSVVPTIRAAPSGFNVFNFGLAKSLPPPHRINNLENSLTTSANSSNSSSIEPAQISNPRLTTRGSINAMSQLYHYEYLDKVTPYIGNNITLPTPLLPISDSNMIRLYVDAIEAWKASHRLAATRREYNERQRQADCLAWEQENWCYHQTGACNSFSQAWNKMFQVNWNRHHDKWGAQLKEKARMVAMVDLGLRLLQEIGEGKTLTYSGEVVDDHDRR